MGTAERKEREKESRKESIIDAAQKVFFEKGLLLATMEEIAERAELAKGTLYLYYKSKEDLYLAVMIRGLNILCAMFESIIAQPQPFIATLVRLIDAYTTFYEQHKNYFRMLHFFQTPQFHKQVSDEMKEAGRQVDSRLWEIAIAQLKRGILEGKLRRDIDPAEMAIMFWSNTTTLLLRIDTQLDFWRDRMNVDLQHTLKISQTLMLESVLTEEGKKEYHEFIYSETRDR